MFERNFEKIDEIKGKPLFTEKLVSDVRSGQVFPALRSGYMDFYHKGGRLFTYNGNKFETHVKYATLPKTNKDYISEDDLKKFEMVDNFLDGYDRIKENCSKYSGDEAGGVSKIYHKHSYASSNGNVVVLDIEVAFDGGKNRIDLLLFNKSKQTLRFYEAKHFSNQELWKNKDGDRKVVGQIRRYEERIKKSKGEILEAYSRYVDFANDLFELKMEKPENVENEVALLLFGFDDNQKHGRLEDLLLGNGSLEGVKYYAKGDLSNISLETVWKVKTGK